LDFDVEKFPWLVAISLSAFLSLIFYSPYDPYFLTTKIPVYLTEVMMFLVIGVEFTEDWSQNRPYIPFLMALTWIICQLSTFDSIDPLIYGWGLFVIQFLATLAYFYGADLVRKYPARAMGVKNPGRDFAYVGLFLIAVTAFVRLVQNFMLGWTALWSIAVLMTCVGYISSRAASRPSSMEFLAPMGAFLGLLVTLFSNTVMVLMI